MPCRSALFIAALLGAMVTEAYTGERAAWQTWARGAATAPAAETYTTEHVQALIVRTALAGHTVPPELALAVAKVESDFDAAAESSRGARGVMQIMPLTAETEFGLDPDVLWDPVVNVAVGIEYLERLYRQYDQRWDAALSHYNGGSLGAASAPPHPHTGLYLSRVLHWQDHFAQRPEIALLIGALSEAPAPRFVAGAAPFSAEAASVARSLRAGAAPRHDGAWSRFAAEISELQARFRASLRRFESNAGDHGRAPGRDW